LESGWSEGLDPYKAVIRDGLLYGRGGADDGYSFFSSIIIAKIL
jgi:acetylornithine deacetylase/succinyl-diaminopimelate desuccinylase-like protein